MCFKKLSIEYIFRILCIKGTLCLVSVCSFVYLSAPNVLAGDLTYTPSNNYSKSKTGQYKNLNYVSSDYGYNPSAAQGQRQGQFSRERNNYFYAGLVGGGNFLASKEVVTSVTGQADVAAQKAADVGFYGGLLVGYKVSSNIRAELEGTYILRGETYGTITGNLNTLRIMANGYLDFDIGSAVKPYLGAGLGMSFMKSDHVNNNAFFYNPQTANVFTYMVGTGITYGLSDNFSLDVGYRFVLAQDAEFTLSGQAVQTIHKHSIAEHNAQVGVKMAF